MVFRNPWFFLLLLLVPVFFYRYLQSNRWGAATVKHPAGFFLKSRALWFQHVLFLLKIAAFVFFMIALARPQKMFVGENVYTRGIDIVITLDISGSMAAEDFKPKNRLEVAKKVMEDFIQGRKTDRIGLVLFAAKAVTRCPVTIDYDVLKRFIDTTHLGMLPDGTAIGNALAVAVGRLKNSKAKTKIVILLTDGVNNTGEIDPITAADMAKALGVKVYTIGVGTRGSAPVPVINPYTGEKVYQRMEVKIDEDLLRKIANMTGGSYFRATDTKALEKIFHQIDSMEKTKIKIQKWAEYQELFEPYLKIGLLILLMWFVLSETIFRRVP